MVVISIAAFSQNPTHYTKPPFDLVAHFLSFMALVMAWRVAFLNSSWLWGVILCVLAGAGIELAQEYWLPSRTASYMDFCADIVGIAVGACLMEWLLRQRKTMAAVAINPKKTDHV